MIQSSPNTWRKRRIEKRCKHCGRSFVPAGAARIGHPLNLCSRKCYYAARALRPVYTGPCMVCGRPCPERDARGVRRIGRQKMCSLACAIKSLRKTVNCVRCGQAFVTGRLRRRKYCSIGCYRQSIVDGGTERGTWVKRPCLFCGAIVKRRRHWVRKRIFCNPLCAGRYSTGERSTNWRGGASLRRGSSWRRQSALARERDGLCCRRCGKSQADNGQKLSVDHVRPWRDCEHEAEANDLRNLISLCRSCHAKKAKLERAWLQGDWMALASYRLSVGLPIDGLIIPTFKAQSAGRGVPDAR